MTDTSSWETIRVLITVKAYPRPSRTLGETDCVAGISSDGKWIRLYPVQWRDLEDPIRFKKWNWIEVRVKKSPKDYREETYIPDHDSIKIVGEVGTGKLRDWEDRKKIVLPLKDSSLEDLKMTDKSLGFVRVSSLEDFILEPDHADWTSEQKAYLSQQSLLGREKKVLEKVPWKFKYHFRCEGPDCPGHIAQIVDWELFQSWRTWRYRYSPGDLLNQLRNKYFVQTNECDLHFFVGTTLTEHRFKNFMVIGLFYPPKTK